MSNTLKSQIFSAGTKFEVTDKSTDSIFGPGTTGFVSFVKGMDQDYRNVFYYRFVTTKRGKGGKERLEISDLSTPVFDIDDENIAKVLPDEKRKYYVHLKAVSPVPCSVMEMSKIDFLAWGLSVARYVRKLNTRAKHVNTWPSSSSDMLNSFVRMDDFYNEDPSHTKANYTTPEVRDGFTRRIRVMESGLVRCALSYMKKIADIEEKAVLSILKSDENIGTRAVLKDTYKSFSSKRAALESLVAAHQVKNYPKDALKAAAGNLSWS